MIKLKAIRSSRDPFDPAAYRRAIRAALDATAKQVKADYDKTVATWRNKPSFSIEAPADNERVIGTDDEIYGYVDDGTRPHVIVAHGKTLAFPGQSSPKTAPRVIGSGGGSRGGATVFTKRVQHPGTDARDFSEVIGEQAEQRLADELQRALDGVE